MEHKCIVCGKPITPCLNGKTRKNAKYCSEACRAEGKRRYYKGYVQRKMAESSEWAEERKANNIEYQRAYRVLKRNTLIKECSKELASMTDEGEIEEYVKEHFRVKVS